jgi:hypothetical protein
MHLLERDNASHQILTTVDSIKCRINKTASSARSPELTEREMCPWAISKYFGDLVSKQVLKCKNGGQSTNQG